MKIILILIYGFMTFLPLRPIFCQKMLGISSTGNIPSLNSRDSGRHFVDYKPVEAPSLPPLMKQLSSFMSAYIQFIFMNIQKRSVKCIQAALSLLFTSPYTVFGWIFFLFYLYLVDVTFRKN